MGAQRNGCARDVGSTTDVTGCATQAAHRNMVCRRRLDGIHEGRGSIQSCTCSAVALFTIGARVLQMKVDFVNRRSDDGRCVERIVASTASSAACIGNVCRGRCRCTKRLCIAVAQGTVVRRRMRAISN